MCECDIFSVVFVSSTVLSILSPSSDQANPVATLILSPSSAQVRTGDSLTLSCSFQGIRIFCYTVTWFRVHPWTREIDTSTKILVDPHENYANECKGTINSTRPSDSGMYYCSIVHSGLSFFSNGSLLTVTGKFIVITKSMSDVEVWNYTYPIHHSAWCSIACDEVLVLFRIVFLYTIKAFLYCNINYLYLSAIVRLQKYTFIIMKIYTFLIP